jgi:hypothetical protein
MHTNNAPGMALQQRQAPSQVNDYLDTPPLYDYMRLTTLADSSAYTRFLSVLAARLGFTSF